MGFLLARIKSLLSKARRKVSAGHVFVGGFALIILAGTFLLMLPCATRGEGSADFLTALFTAVSSTCVTGLVVQDTAQYWTLFGQSIILIMIQIGGLGFMSLVALTAFFTKRAAGVRTRILMARSIGMNETGQIESLMKHTIIGTLIFEGCGAALLSVRFARDYGVADGIRRGIFHSVSAFCNAGFDLMGDKTAFTSLGGYAADPIVNAVIMILIITGGLGFFVWEDIWQNRSPKKLSLHTKIVLVVTPALIITGALLFFLWEGGNPNTMGGLSLQGKITAAFFESVTARTAGFSTINQAGLTDSSKALLVLLMSIGGSPGSTAGGLKTVTVAITLLSAFSTLRGRRNVILSKKTVPQSIVGSALSLIIIALAFLMLGTFAIASIENLPFLDVLIETSSAYATVGISTGITPYLGTASKLIIIALMFIGRVGVLTVGYVILARRRDDAKIKYPDAHILLG